MFPSVKTQSPPSSNMDNIASEDAISNSNFQPSLIVVVGVLAAVFFIAFLLLIYAKFCYKSSHSRDGVNVHNTSNSGRLIRSTSRFSGIDKMVIKSLPFFRFSSLKGTREGLECVVCLSKFEDVEVLRLLPKCKHAFHIDCVDQWLENHSSCPLCRHKISIDDTILFTNSSSLRILRTHSEIREDSTLQLFIEREEENNHGSSRFSCGGSFSRRFDKPKREEEMPIQQESSGGNSVNENGRSDDNDDEEILHKLNHKIIVSDVVLKNRWSNVSSSDLIFLNSNMLNEISSKRFSSPRSNNEKYVKSKAIEDVEMLKIKEEMGRKRAFESKLSKITQSDKIPFVCTPSGTSSEASKVLNHSEKRSISEITIHPRFKGLSVNGEFCVDESHVKEERMRSVWLPIAQRTAQWFANRERRDSQFHNTRDSLNV